MLRLRTHATGTQPQWTRPAQSIFSRDDYAGPVWHLRWGAQVSRYGLLSH